MSRTDMLMLRRMLPRIGLSVVVFLGLMILVESLNTSRFALMSKLGGPMLAGIAILIPALRSSIGAMPVTILLGTIIGVIEMQQRGEMTALKATGRSIWQIMRAPLIVVLVLSGIASIAGETLTIMADRALPAHAHGASGPHWLEQVAGDEKYVLFAQSATAVPPEAQNVQIFMTGATNRGRIVADKARLEPGRWVLSNVTRYSRDGSPEHLTTLELATMTSTGDLSLEVTGARDLTLPELISVVSGNASKSDLRAVTWMSFYRTFSLPFIVLGAMLIGFAFTSRYRRRHDYGTAALTGLVAGFVLYVVNELAVRAGNAQALPTLAAAAGPALLSVLVGLTALLYLEDGRA